MWEMGDLASHPQPRGTWEHHSFTFLRLSFLVCKMGAIGPSPDLRLPSSVKRGWGDAVGEPGWS